MIQINKKLKMILIILNLFGLGPKYLIKNNIVKKIYLFYQFIFIIIYVLSLILNIYHKDYLYILIEPLMNLYLTLFSDFLNLLYLCIQTKVVITSEKNLQKLIEKLNLHYNFIKNQSDNSVNWILSFFILLFIFLFFVEQILSPGYNKMIFFTKHIPEILELIYFIFVYLIFDIFYQELKIFNQNIINKNYKIKKLIKIHNDFINILEFTQNIFSIIFLCCFLLNTIIVADVLLFTRSVYKYRDHDPKGNFIVIYLILWVLFKLCKILYLIKICNRVCKQVLIFFNFQTQFS